jgi:hypothetical protein
MQKEKQQAADKEKEENREKRLRELVPARRCRHCRVAFTSDRKLEAHEEKCTPKPVGQPVNALRDTAASHKQHLELAAAADSAHRTELGKLQHVFKTATDLKAWQADPRCNLMALARVPADAEAVSTEQHRNGTITVTLVRKQPVVRRGCARPGRGSDVPLPTADLLSVVVPLWQKHCEGSGISAHFMLEALEKLPAFQDCPERLPTLAVAEPQREALLGGGFPS